tara:strand:+ start:691 stop:831 length:141 start_codon:yes stop_codon:yes gene_type:complete
LFFSISSGKKNEKGYSIKLLEWENAKMVPWGVAMLIGGGLEIASSF